MLPPQKQPRKVVVVRDFLNTTVDTNFDTSQPQTAAVPR